MMASLPPPLIAAAESGDAERVRARVQLLELPQDRRLRRATAGERRDALLQRREGRHSREHAQDSETVLAATLA